MTKTLKQTSSSSIWLTVASFSLSDMIRNVSSKGERSRELKRQNLTSRIWESLGLENHQCWRMGSWDSAPLRINCTSTMLASMWKCTLATCTIQRDHSYVLKISYITLGISFMLLSSKDLEVYNRNLVYLLFSVQGSIQNGFIFKESFKAFMGGSSHGRKGLPHLRLPCRWRKFRL